VRPAPKAFGAQTKCLCSGRQHRLVKPPLVLGIGHIPAARIRLESQVRANETRSPECICLYLNLRSTNAEQGRAISHSSAVSLLRQRFGWPRETAAPWRHMRSPECLWRSLKVSSAMPDLSSSPNPSATMRSYWSLVAHASGNSRPRLRARLSAMPLSLAA
jgi:hypothetical protein